MNKKKILSLTLILCVAAIMVVGGTLAYFTDTDNATNTFTMGNVDIDLWESDVEKDDTGDYQPIDDTKIDDGNDYEDVFPGQFISKDPTVTNEGSYDAYLRVTVEMPMGIENIMAKYCDKDLETAFGMMFEDYDVDLWDLTNTVSMDGLFNGGKVKAILVFDYNGILEAGQDVTLFTGINMPAEMTADDVTGMGLTSFEMPIKAYATQVKGFAADETKFVASERDAAIAASFN